MDTKLIEIHRLLNRLYELAKMILVKLEERDLPVSLKHYEGNYIKIAGQYEYQHYPIPIILVEGIGDININLDQISFEFFVKKEELNVTLVENILEKSKVEVYGGKNCLVDFYREGDSAKQVVDKIKNSNERDIGIAYYLSKEFGEEEVIHQFLRAKQILGK